MGLFSKDHSINSDTAQKFSNSMDFVKEAIDREKNPDDRIVVLDFVMNVIKQDLKTYLLANMFYSTEQSNKRFKYPIPLFYNDEQGHEKEVPVLGEVKVDLAKSCVLVLPWNRKKLRNQIKNINDNEFIFDPKNHGAYYFPYIDLCYVHKGKHSISSGIVHEKGSIEATAYDLTKLFAHVSTDGETWYNNHGRKRLNELIDFRIGVIYEIAKIKYAQENLLE